MNTDMDMSALISGMLSDPEMLSKAMNIAKGLASSGVLSSFLADDGKGDAVSVSAEGEKHSSGGEAVSQSLERQDNDGGRGGEKKRKKPGNAERIALLYALKPYLSEDKCEKIELIIKLMSVFDAAHSLGIK